ncbi:hypothetical protein ACFL2S_14850 [Thermodesulfobacteriota bacterium]
MDNWGRDPSVRAMRRVFTGMEKALDDFLQQLNIDPLDHRIRGWLEQALAKYENAWGVASRMGVHMDEDRAPAVYARCLLKVISLDGIKIPVNMLPIEIDTERLISEVFK